jgi:hypothetical protein
MARIGWFDPQTNQLAFDGYAEHMQSWQDALADGKVEAEEIRQQAERVAELLKALEPKLSDDVHEELTRVFYEMAVLYGMERLADLTLERG